MPCPTTPPLAKALRAALATQRAAPPPARCPTCKTPWTVCRELLRDFGQRCCGYCTTSAAVAAVADQSTTH